MRTVEALTFLVITIMLVLFFRSIVTTLLILVMVGVPPEGIGLILGVDRFLDMCRTTLNVTGDLVAATVVSRGEKDIPAEVSGPLPVAPPTS